MSDSFLSRRKFLSGTAATAGLILTGSNSSDRKTEANERRFQHGKSPWPLSLDTSTIRPTGTITDKVDIVAKAGYEGIEPWESELNEYEEEGGDLKDLGKKIKDSGMEVPNVIALWNAIPPTQEEWESREEDHRKRFRQASEVGAKYIQTVLTPARSWQEYDLNFAADRFHDLLEMGINDYGVIPSLNFLQFLPHNQRIGQASAIALNSNHNEATIIPDTFHMYVGGSGFNGLKHLQGHFISIFQINDVPASPPREELEDRHRVYPGDGIFPLADILRDLKQIGFKEYVSLQLFNREYWEQDALHVAKTGLEKMLSVIEEAGV